MKYLIGSSLDFHNIKFVNGYISQLGLVSIKTNYKIIAESDGDIVIHAICDAILGALGKKDIGEYFTKKDMILNNSSLKILDFCLLLMKKEKLQINNVDITIISDHIMITKFRGKIKEKLVKKLSCNNVNIKATRWENINNFKVGCLCSLLLHD